MVADNFSIRRSGFAAGPLKTDAPLVIDPNRMLTFAVSFQRFEPIGIQCGKVAQRFGCIENAQSLFRLPSDWLPSPDCLTRRQPLRVSVAVASDHPPVPIIRRGSVRSCNSVNSNNRRTFSTPSPATPAGNAFPGSSNHPARLTSGSNRARMLAVIRHVAVLVTILQFATGATAQTNGLHRSPVPPKPDGMQVIESAAKATLEDKAIRVTLPLSAPAGPATRVTMWLASPRRRAVRAKPPSN